MATEINIQESVYLKHGESEENRLTSESFEEKVTKLLGNKVKQLETSSQVAETVNTPLETGKPTAESGTFFQALSVPMVIADEHSKIPESCNAAKQTEPEEETTKFEEKAIGNEVCEEDAPEKVESEVGSKLFDSMAPIKKEALEKNQGDSDGVTSSEDAACEDIKETTEHDVTTVADLIKEQDRYFVKEEPGDKSIDAQEAIEQCEIGSKGIEEQKSKENIDKIEQDEEIRPVKVENGNSSVELNEAIPTLNKDEDEEKEQEVNVLEKDQDKDDITSTKEVTFEGGLQEKNDHNEDNEHEFVKAKASIEDDTDVYVSTQTIPVQESIKNEEPDDEKAIEKEVCEENDPEKAELGGIEISDSVVPSQKEPVNVIEKDQGDSDGVTSSQEAPCVDVEESTTVQHVTTVIDFKEQDLNEKPREFIEEETEDKSLDAQEASEEFVKGTKEDVEQNPEERVKKTEKEEETEEIEPGVEIEEKKEQNELLPAITTDVCIPTQTKSQVEETEQEEEDAQNDNGLKEKSDNPSIKEVCEETGSENAEYEEIATVNKGENGDEEEEQEVNVLEKDEGENDVTTAQDVAFEKDLPEKNHHNEYNESEVVTAEESKEKDTEVIGSSEKTEPSDVCISTLTEPKEETTEKNEEEAVESDGGQTNSGTSMVKEIHEENVSEKTEAEEGLNLSDSFSTALNENETVREDEDQEKEQEICVSEEGQGGRDEVTSSENASNKDIKEATIGQHDTTVASFETGQGLSATHREIIIEAEKSNDAQEETEQYDDGANGEREQKLEESVDETANSCSKNEQEEYTEEIKPSVETIEEKDVCISTQIESQEEATKNEENAIESDGDKVKTTEYEVKATESEENNDEETIKNDDGQTEKPERPLTEVVCEATSTEMAESEEGVKHFDSFSTTLNENETLSREEKLEKEDEIKTSEEVQSGDDVTISQNASNDDKKEDEIKTTIGQHDTTEANVDEGQGVNTMPKEIFIEAEDKTIDAEEMSLELGQPNEQNVEETHPCEAINENPEDEINKEDKDLSHEIVEDTNDNNTKEEKCTIEQEPVEKHSGQDEVSKEKVNDLNGTTEVEPREDITPSASLEDTSNSEKKKAESEILPIEDHETVSKVQIPELVPKSEESVLKEECFISETETHLDEEKEIVTKEISSDEKTEVEGDGDDVTSSQIASSEDTQEITAGQHVKTVAYVEDGQGVSSTPKEILIEEVEDKYIDAEEISRIPNEQNVDETRPCPSETTSENPEDENKKVDKDLSHESVEDTNDDTTEGENPTLEQEPVEEHNDRDEVPKEKVTDLNETIEAEPQEDITPCASLETSTEYTSNSEKEKERTNLPIEDLETVSEVQIPELVPKSEDSVLKEESFISETEKHLDEEKEIVSKEISSDEKTEVQGGEDDVTSSQNASGEDIQETTTEQHVTTVEYVEDGQGVSAMPKEILIEEAEDKSIDATEISLELGQPNEQNAKETHPYLSEIISENPEDEIKKEDKDLSHESVKDTNDDTIKEEKRTLEQEPVEEHSGQDDVSKENVTDLSETTEVEPQEDIIPSTSLETSTEDTSNSEKEKAESENFPIEDLETVSEIQIPELVPKSEESVLKEECLISETEKHLEEEKEIVLKDIPSDEKTEQKTEIKQETVKEVCEETSSEKPKLEEGLELSDSSNMKINEKEITILKDDDEEKDHEVNMSAESQGEDNITSSHNEVSEEKEELKEKNYYNEGNAGDGVDEDAEEIKSSVETKEYIEHVIATNVCSSKQNKTDEETMENEEKNGEKAIEYDENETLSGEENLIKKKQDVEETKMGEHATTVTYIEEGQSLATVTKDVHDKEEGDKAFVVQEESEQYDDGANDKEQQPEEHTDLTSSQNASNEDIKDTTIDQHDTTVAYVKEGQGVIAMPKDILKEAEDKSIDAEEISLELRKPNEQNVDETCPCPSEIISENPEYENKKVDKYLAQKSVEDTHDNNTEVEKPTLEQVPVEEHNDQDEVSKEKVTDLNETTEVEPQEDITPYASLETSTEDTSNSKKEKAESENLPTEDLETVSEVQIPELVPKSEDSVLKEECFISETETHLKEEKGTIIKEISSDEKTKQTTEIKQEIVKEECEETRSEKAEFEEGFELSNEKGITGFEDENQGKDQEINMSAESQCEDNITSSRKEASEEKEDLQVSNESDFIKSREGVDEDIEEVKSSVETKENTEHVITTNVCSSTQIEPVEETTKNEERNGEKAIDNDENEKVSREENLENKQEDVCSSAQTEPKEETTYNEEMNEEATENDDGQMNLENQKKKQELEISELQSGGDDVISSQNASNEDIKETSIGQHATTMAHFEEGLGVNAITKEILKEELEDKSVNAQEASEQSENGAKENIEQQPEESVDKHVHFCSESIEGSTKEEADAENKEIESELEAEKQAGRTEDRSEMKDETVLAEKVTKELGQPNEQNVEEIHACLTETISETTEDKITKKDEDISHDSTEHINENITKEEKCFPDGITKEIEISTLEHEPVGEQNDSQDEVSKGRFTDSNETTAVEPQEDATPSSSLGTSTEDTSSSDKAKAESENLPIEDLESVSEVHILEVTPISEDSKMKEECLTSATATATHVEEENGTVTRESPSDENLEIHGSTQQPENSYSTIEESVSQLEQPGEINSHYENRDMKEDVTQETQLNSTEDSSEMVKDVILTKEIEQVTLEMQKEKELNYFKEQIVEEDIYSPELDEKSAQNQKEIVHEISNSDSIPVENPEVTETNVHGQIGQEDNSCESKVTNDKVDQEPKEESIPSLEDAAKVESQVDLSNTESTAYPSETEKLATRALESDCDVQISEVVADSEDSKVKEEFTVLETAEYTYENVEEQDRKTNGISSAPDKEQENVTEAPAKSDEAKSSHLIIEEKALTKENLEVHGELELTSEPMIEEDQVTIERVIEEDQNTIETKPRPDSDITCENITDDQTLEFKLEHTSGKDLEDGKGDKEEDATLAPENEIKSSESQNETTKNIILTDEVAVETEKEKERSEIKGQVSEEDNCPTELDNTSTPNQKELANEIEYSKPIPVEDTEVTEVKAESQIVENIQAAEDLNCSSKASPIIETSKVEMHEDTEQTTTIIEEVKDDSIDEASKDKIIPVLEDSKASELQVDLPEIESTDTALNGQDSMKLSEDVSCRTQETTEEQGVLISQLADREILEEKDVEPKSEVQTFSEDQRSIKEEAQGSFGVEIKGENEAVEDVIINEVLLEDEKAKESKGIKDIINEDAKLNQSTSDTDEVCQIERSSSRPRELLEAKDTVEDTEDPKFLPDNLNVKDDTFTVVKGPNEDREVIASEIGRLEKTVTEENIIKADADKEKVTLGEPQADDSAKATCDSTMSSTEQDVVARSEESGDDDMLKLEEKPTEVPEITTEVAEIVPTCREASATDVKIREQGELVHRGSQEPSEENTLLSQNDNNTENLEVLPSVEKDAIEGVDKRFEEALVIDVQKHEKDLDHETKAKIVDVESNVECSEIEPLHLDTKEATSEFINQENQREQKKEADESIEAVIPVEDVKTSTREIEVGSVDVEVPSVTDATADKANSKTVEVHEAGKEEGSAMKQEQLELDAPETFGTATTEDFKISQKSVTDDLINISQTHPEVQKYEVSAYTVDKQSPNEPHQKESTESKILTEKIDSSHEQGEPIAKSLIPEAANLKANEALGTEPQTSKTVSIDQKEKSESVDPAKFKMAGVLQEQAKRNSEVAETLIGERDSALTKDQQVEKEEVGESGVKTDEEGEEEEEDNEIGSCSDAPVMVEASKDMEVKAPKKSHNILSGVGSKVKHSIAKVKKAITGKSSPPKPPSPKAKNQVVG
ncbi:hypothetical protein L1987_65787 [Smallanthus sonchifolius]|uniref:Uncharacterized protein n=1 Tax=Smallanthus sonchifolius TaxID=185202 RepID=A0ACB9BVG1_9ASTR|nr:hypothetical protein L1987_65787 [Smallanthus sonchifolius]